MIQAILSTTQGTCRKLKYPQPALKKQTVQNNKHFCNLINLNLILFYFNSMLFFQ